VDELPAEVVGAPVVARARDPTSDAMARPSDPAELLDVDVDELARRRFGNRHLHPRAAVAAASAGTLPETEARTLGEAYDLFAILRLEHQVQQLESGLAPDNHIDPRALNHLTRRYLRDAFRAVASVQNALAGELRWSTLDG
jgi:hypothetical protein